MSIPQPEASGIPAGEQALASHPETSLEPALQLSPQAKPKPIEELSAKDANDMTCAICLDQIPVQELCAIKGCDHVYCGSSMLSHPCMICACLPSHICSPAQHCKPCSVWSCDCE